jgi:hypothetical protein
MSLCRTVAAACLLVAACAAPKPAPNAAEEAELLDVPDGAYAGDDEVDPADDAGDDGPALPPRVACYFGELMVAKPGEEQTNQGALLVKLTIDPAKSRMVEEIWSFPLYERYDITRTIDGAAFTMRQDDGSFTGSGTLDGEPWIWRGWASTSRSADQSTLVETSTRFVDGALVTREKVMNKDGQLRVEIHHELDEVPLDECDRMFAKARANAAKLRASAD